MCELSEQQDRTVGQVQKELREAGSLPAVRAGLLERALGLEYLSDYLHDATVAVAIDPAYAEVENTTQLAEVKARKKQEK